MSLCRLPRAAMTAYLAFQIAAVFSVMMTTDMATPIYHNYYWSRRRDMSYIVIAKAFVHLFSMATIIRCFILIGKAYMQKDKSASQSAPEKTKCPFKRTIHCIGALSHELVMTSIWITAVVLSFTSGNDPAGITSVIVLLMQIFQSVSVLGEIIHAHLIRAKVRTRAGSTASSASSADLVREDGEYQAIGPMFIPKYRDSDAADAEKGHSHGENRGRESTVDAQDIDQKILPRLSEDTVGDFEGENDALLK